MNNLLINSGFSCVHLCKDLEAGLVGKFVSLLFTNVTLREHCLIFYDTKYVFRQNSNSDLEQYVKLCF